MLLTLASNQDRDPAYYTIKRVDDRNERDEEDQSDDRKRTSVRECVR
jgi:hypothetical protein